MRPLRAVLAYVGLFAVPVGIVLLVVAFLTTSVPFMLASAGVMFGGLGLLWLASAIKFDDYHKTRLGRFMRWIDRHINRHPTHHYMDHGG